MLQNKMFYTTFFPKFNLNKIDWSNKLQKNNLKSLYLAVIKVSSSKRTGTAGYGYKDIHQIFFCGSTLSKFHYKILINIRV